MAGMGEAGPEVWDAEFRRTGQVVFPQRWRGVVFQLSITVVVGAVALFVTYQRAGGSWGAIEWNVLGAAAGAALVGVAGFSVWQLITGRPMVVVDSEGVSAGRGARRIGWREVSTIVVRARQSISREVVLVPIDPSASPVTIRDNNVKDLDAFLRWLEQTRVRQLHAG
ncbi:hypothetical protein AB0P21_21935 [Kribbella sp. NPDC056861]|uniref:hypothetical protein n=1 Tax=Kribbella sp. NPDC056861 TaxID=3154857 RepID=UPI00341909C2